MKTPIGPRPGLFRVPHGLRVFVCSLVVLTLLGCTSMRTVSLPASGDLTSVVRVGDSVRVVRQDHTIVRFKVERVEGAAMQGAGERVVATDIADLQVTRGGVSQGALVAGGLVAAGVILAASSGGHDSAPAAATPISAQAVAATILTNPGNGSSPGGPTPQTVQTTPNNGL